MRAPAAAAASRIFGISWSVIAGTTGATITPTGMPAAASRSIAFSRSRGWEARGSILRATSGSSVVIESMTTAAWCSLSSWRMSMSRVTSSFLVMTPTGLRNSASTARHRRVISSRRSAG